MLTIADYKAASRWRQMKELAEFQRLRLAFCLGQRKGSILVTVSAIDEPPSNEAYCNKHAQGSLQLPGLA